MRVVPLLFVIGALLVAPARAEIVSVTVEATGANVQDATSNALVEAVRQVNGVSVDARQLLASASVSGVVSDSDGNTTRFSATQEQRGTVQATSSGHLAGYRVLESGASEYGYRVRLEARIHRYRAPGIDSDNRRKLALIPLASRPGTIDFFGPVDARQLAGELSQAMLVQFVQSRRFAILDRESWAAIGQERALLASSDTPVSEKAKLGQALGADYLVLGELLEAGGGRYVESDRLTGVQRAGAGAVVAVSYRIVVPATGEIKFADSVELDVMEQRGQRMDTRMAALNELARRLVGIALDRIYPMRVISTEGSGQVVLNQGGASLAVGDRLVLLDEGRAMVDPYTKEPLGRLETEVGQLEIVRVDGKMAYARLAGGSGAAPKVGQLARRDLGLYGAGIESPVPPPRPREDGVRLPFD